MGLRTATGSLCGKHPRVLSGSAPAWRTEIDPRVINVQSHWWYPELPHREPWLGGLWESNCNVLTPADDPDLLDPVTGGWPMRALLCKIYKAEGPSMV